MKKTNIKPLLYILLVMILLYETTNTVYAYSTLGYKWKSSTIKYYYENFNSARAKTFINTGANGWSTTNVNFSSGNAGNYNVYCSEVNNSNVSWDGLTTSYYSGAYFTSQNLQLNRAITSTWNSDGALKSVAIHEFGHCLGLDHLNGRVIMNPYTWGNNSRYGSYNISTIQLDDKNGANALY